LHLTSQQLTIYQTTTIFERDITPKSASQKELFKFQTIKL
jgi:hypothetical protein